jgi:hypothetical protein
MQTRTPSLIISPINKKTSGADYNGQVAAHEQGHLMRWDDSYKNLARVGDYFAFTFHGNKVLFYEIVDILTADHRPEEWKKRPEHKERRVVVLGEQIHCISWANWLALDGSKRPNGTTHLRYGCPSSTALIDMLVEITQQIEKSLVQLLDATSKRARDLDSLWDAVCVAEDLPSPGSSEVLWSFELASWP